MFYLINNKEIKQKTYNYIFSLCDSGSFLYSDLDSKINLEQAISSTRYNSITNDILSTKNGRDIWNMDGVTYTFKLSEQIKNLILEKSLSHIFELSNICRLENLTLYKNNKLLYSICSHEGYEDFDEEFKNLVSDFCLKEIENTTLYKELVNKLNNLKCDKEEIIKNLTILQDLNAYVSKDCDALIYVSPKFECTFECYLKLTKDYLSGKFFNLINIFNSYKAMHPTGFPNLENMYTLNFTPFETTEIYKELTEEIQCWNAVLLNKFGLTNLLNA